MSSSIDIYPFTLSDTASVTRFGIQTLIFLIGIFVAYKLIVKPALRLHEERKKRTVGSSDSAKKNIEKANVLEHEYFTRLKLGAQEARKMRAQEISDASTMAHNIVTEAQHKSNEHLKKLREQLDHEMLEAKTKFDPLLDEIIKSVFNKLGIAGSFLLLILSSFFDFNKVFALTTNEILIPSFWYSIFWPYFQFAIFIAVAFYLGKKPIKALLEKRRDDFRAQLSEAHEAVYLADKRLKEYEAKVASLEAELNAIKVRNMEDAKLERYRIISEANKATLVILKDAERTAAELINSSRDEIKKELFMLALTEVEKRLSHDKLVLLDQKFKTEALENIKNLH